MGCNCYKTTTIFSLLLSVLGFAASAVGLFTNYWFQGTFYGYRTINEGLLWTCMSDNCKMREYFLQFRDGYYQKDIVVVLLIGSLAFTLLSIILYICLAVKRKTKSCCLVSFSIIFNLLAACCGVACVVYANQSNYEFHEDILDQWSLLVTCIGAGLLVIAMFFSFGLCCSHPDPHSSLSYYDNHELHSNVGTLSRSTAPPEIRTPPYAPAVPTTPSYNDLQQQVGYYPQQQQQHFQYPSLSHVPHQQPVYPQANAYPSY